MDLTRLIFLSSYLDQENAVFDLSSLNWYQAFRCKTPIPLDSHRKVANALWIADWIWHIAYSGNILLRDKHPRNIILPTSRDSGQKSTDVKHSRTIYLDFANADIGYSAFYVQSPKSKSFELPSDNYVSLILRWHKANCRTKKVRELDWLGLATLCTHSNKNYSRNARCLFTRSCLW